MRHVTNLNKRQIFLVLDMLDQDATGYIEFKDFYLLMCIFIALKVTITCVDRICFILLDIGLL